MIDVLRVFYIVCAMSLSIYTLGQLILLIIYLRHRKTHTIQPPLTYFPSVAVQLPIYNERYVIKRLLDAVANFDYPPEKLSIQVLDDSDDDTGELVAKLVERYHAQGINIRHIQRPNRSGYKAGALAYGLTCTDAEIIAVFDADFVPPADFLRKTVPYMVHDHGLGIVQTRWGHLNAEANLLTRAQALAIDAHFVVEQKARNRGELLLTFNGTGGLWRRACIEDAGGWSDDTLTEDLDLSYRAQIKGWRYLFLPEIVVSGEIPPQLDAYKRQQARWAKGSNQSLVKLIPYLWRGKLTYRQRIMALQHLCQYLPQPIMFLILLLTPPLLIMGALEGLPLAPLGIIGLVPPLIHVVAQMSLYKDWAKRLLAFPMVMVLGTGLVWNNTVAAWEAFSGLLRGERGEFKRTPKFAKRWAQSNYALTGDKHIWVELFLAVYATSGTISALFIMPAVAPYLGLYAVSFSLVTSWGFYDRWQIARKRNAQILKSKQHPLTKSEYKS